MAGHDQCVACCGLTSTCASHGSCCRASARRHDSFALCNMAGSSGLKCHRPGGGGARQEICALRPAPLQITYLGFPGSCAADFIDYAIVDAEVVPPDSARHYTEQLIYMPHCYQCNDNGQSIAPGAPARKEFGLPSQGMVFCSFNGSQKLDPVMVAAWMRILGQVPDAVLWLYVNNPWAEENLKREADARGVAASRLIFANGLPKAQHLRRLQLADIALDTRIYNGHTTTSDALWAGVPVVTLRGRHFASRVSASCLHAIGLPELVTESLSDYEALAVKLAQDGGFLRATRQKLMNNRLSQPLFDTARFRSEEHTSELQSH